ncbi:MAG: hypothetical protein ACRERC_23425 [Candidatus Binatia bacterium]
MDGEEQAGRERARYLERGEQSPDQQRVGALQDQVDDVIAERRVAQS